MAKQSKQLGPVHWLPLDDAAPRDRQLLVTHPAWPCPAVVQWKEATGKRPDRWGFVDEIVERVEGFVADATLCSYIIVPAYSE